MNNYKNKIINEIWDEVWSGCGEQLELVDPRLWNMHLAKVLMNMLVKEREITKYYKNRIDNENNQCRTGIRGMGIPS